MTGRRGRARHLARGEGRLDATHIARTSSTARRRHPMSRRVPKSGPKVFTPDADDTRPFCLVPVGGVILKCRFPRITSMPWSNKPIVPEIILMSAKPQPGKPTEPDPYKTLPLEAA